MNLPKVSRLKGNISDKKILLRVDFNVPIIDDKVANDFRIQKSLKTIDFLKEEGAKIVLVSHISDSGTSLRPIYEKFNDLRKATFVEKCFSQEGKEVVSNMKAGEIVFCENIRNYKGEKENSVDFAKKLASTSDIYVNEAFSVSHREHASIDSITRFLPSYVGFQFYDEVRNLSVVMNPPHPFLFILGGAKFGTKVPLVKKFSQIADKIALGGAISTEFFDESGVEIGKSLYSKKDFDTEELSRENILLPVDLRVVGPDGERIARPDDIKDEDRIVDLGPKTIAEIKKLARDAKLILWNGPVGEYKEGYGQMSIEIAKIMSQSNAQTIIGGGDTLTVVSGLNLLDKISFISTAGGAMLEFISRGTLPGVEALKNSKK